MVYGCHTMKMTFQVPDQVGRKFRKAIPPGKRSALIVSFMANATAMKEDAVIAACQRANRLAKVDAENKDWEKFDDSDA
jgi:hypothetical protein